MDDRELVGRCLGGSEEAWSEFWARLGPAMRRAAVAKLRNAADAEEVCQRVMARLATDGGKALGSFRGTSSLEGWLVAVVWREAITHLRSRRALPSLDERRAAWDAQVPTPLASLCGREVAVALKEALDRMPPREALVLRLRYWQQASHADIARTLGISSNSVTSVEWRALKRLRGLVRDLERE